MRRKNSWDQARESTARDTADIRTEKPDTHAVSGVIHGEAARHAGPTGASPEKKARRVVRARERKRPGRAPAQVCGKTDDSIFSTRQPYPETCTHAACPSLRPSCHDPFRCVPCGLCPCRPDDRPGIQGNPGLRKNRAFRPGMAGLQRRLWPEPAGCIQKTRSDLGFLPDAAGGRHALRHLRWRCGKPARHDTRRPGSAGCREHGIQTPDRPALCRACAGHRWRRQTRRGHPYGCQCIQPNRPGSQAGELPQGRHHLPGRDLPGPLRGHGRPGQLLHQLQQFCRRERGRRDHEVHARRRARPGFRRAGHGTGHDHSAGRPGRAAADRRQEREIG